MSDGPNDMARLEREAQARAAAASPPPQPTRLPHAERVRIAAGIAGHIYAALTHVVLDGAERPADPVGLTAAAAWDLLEAVEAEGERRAGR